jgi:predicted metal-dependent hydrolase
MTSQLSLDFGEHPEPEPLQKGFSGVALHQRELRHNGVLLRYQLTRSRRRSIGLVIGENGLRISAPSWVGMSQIEDAIRNKFPWIQRKLQDLEMRRQKMLVAEAAWQFGGQIPFMGQALALHAGLPPEAGSRSTVWFEASPDQASQPPRLWLSLPTDAPTQRIREMTQGWLQAQAKNHFSLRLAAFKASCGLAPSSWRLSSAASRWGSCNSQGRISLNWRLIHFEPAVIDYVVAHELAHLRELNHSDAFWKVLRDIYPDYLQGHQLLKSHVPGELPEL